MRPTRKGSPARFTWQSILVLRLAVLLRDRFSIELKAHKDGFDDLRTQLDAISFIALWGQRLAMQDGGRWSFVGEGTSMSYDALVVHLDPHLVIIRDGFALQDSQLELFTLPTLHAPQAEVTTMAQSVREARRGTV